MAEWYSVRLESKNTRPKSIATFGALGHPFSFTSASLPGMGGLEWVYRCFEKPKGNEAMSELSFLPYVLRECEGDDDEELFETGWYLSGVGHHQVWCGVNLKDAVDEAQEHIAWDGRDPTNLPTPRKENGDGMLSHRLPYHDESAWLDDELWFGMFTGRYGPELPLL